MLPQPIRDRQRFDFDAPPPRRLVTMSVQFTMVGPTQGNCELITYLAAERPGLGKTQMVGIGRPAAAHQAWLGGNEFSMVVVAQANGLGRHAAAADA
jgi:hypothetical protein